MLAFYQAADPLTPIDPDRQAMRQKIKTAAQNALDYLAAEFAFQSFEGKRMPPFRRNYGNKEDVDFYSSDYVPHIFGVLTGAYVFSDDETGPYHWERIDQQGGFALWALLSGYRVPHPIHDFMLNKHGGYFARIQTRYSSDSYPLKFMIDPGGIADLDPAFARPRYFQDVSSGDTSPESYDVAGPGDFKPVTQLYFATRDYLNSAGGHNEPYYSEIKIPRSLIELLIIGIVLPPIAGILALIGKQLNSLINKLLEKSLRGSDVNSRPSTLITRGDLQIQGETDIDALERVLPAMRGQDDYWASKNLSTYKSFSLGYTFKPGQERHQDWPQRYPQAWNEFRVEQFGIGRASVHVFDFTAQPDHPLAGHYWVLAKFSKSENKGQFRNYGRGFWEVVPGHQFPNAAALAAHIRDINPAKHFDNDEDHHYTYRLASTGERVVIHNRFGSTATDQAILEIRTPDETPIPLTRYTADLRDEAALRQLPLMDVWQVDRDYNFTGMKYAHADGHGRVVIHNPFVDETLILDSSDYRVPTRSSNTAAFITTQLPAINGTQGQIPSVGALALDTDVIYATHYFVPALFKPSLQPGELVALDRDTLTPIKRVTVGKAPHAIAIHHATQRVYVVNYQDHSLSVIDGGSFAVLDTLVFAGWGEYSAAVSQKYHRVFVIQAGQKRVLVIDGQTRTQLAPMNNLPIAGDIVVDEATDRLYVIVTNAANARLQDVVEFEISAEGQRELRRTTMDGQVSRSSEMAVDAEQLYVINNHPLPNVPTNQKLTVLDRRTLTVIDTVPLRTGGLGVAASASQNVVYVTTMEDVQVIDARTRQVLRKIPLNAGQAKGVVAVDERTGAAYFGGSGNSMVTLIGPAPVALGQ
jgi:DNA-binding beta-propeller fold protein YncE